MKEEGDRQEMMDPAEGMLAFCIGFESGAMRLLTSCLKLAVSPFSASSPALITRRVSSWNANFS